jgi:hypothetical protein
MKLRNISLRAFTSIFFFAIIISGAFLFSSNAQAATFTVCASGCSSASIGGAYFMTTSDNGDIVEVKGLLNANPYNPTTESYPLNLSVYSDVTIQCVDEGSGVATIGNAGSSDVIELRADDLTIKDCNLDRLGIRLQNDNGLIDNNVFIDSSAPSDIDLISGTGNTISNNTDINGMSVWGAAVDTRITGNEINIQYASGMEGVGLQGAAGGSGGSIGTEIDNNTFTNGVTGRANYSFIDGSGSDPLGEGISIHDNTFSFPTQPADGDAGGTMVSLWSGGALGTVPIDNTSIYNNYFTFATHQTTDSCYAIVLLSDHGVIAAEVYNNTINMSDSCGAEYSGIYSFGDYGRTIDLTYNLIYSDSLTSKYGMRIGKGVGGQTITEDYNGFYNIGEVLDQNNIVTSGGHRYTASPGMKTGDENLDNNMEPFPASCYLDVNGGTDVGAYSGSRRATEGDGKVHIKVNDNGIINYSSVDFQSLSQAAEALCDDMVLDVADGSYSGPVTLSSLDGIEITGTLGSGSTTLDATGQSYGFSLDNVDNSTISGFNIIGDSSTIAAIYLTNGSGSNALTDLILKGVSDVTTTYTKTDHRYVYNGMDYTTNLMMVYLKTGAGSDFYNIDSEDKDLTTEVMTGSPSGTVYRDWNLGLAESGGNPYSFYFNSSDYPLESDALTELNALGMGTWTIDCWFENAYVWSGNSYVYTAPTGCAAGDPTIAAGYQTSPAIPEITTKSSGALYIENSDNNQISSSRIGSGDLPNGYGVSLVGSSAINTIGSSMTWETNNSADVFTSSTGDNTITDCTDLSYILAGIGALTGCQTSPSGTLSSPTQDSGENTISFTFTASDQDHETLKAKVEYEQTPGGACTGPWLKANLDTTVGATLGTPTVDNSAGYQITNILSSNTNTISGTWIANEIEGVDGDHCLQITVNDEAADQTTPSAKIVSYTYQAPTPPAETGGTSIGAFLSGIAASPAADTPDEPAEDEPVAEDEPTDEPVDEPVDEPADEPAEELPVSTVSDAVEEYVVEPVYEYFVEPAPVTVETPEPTFEYIETEVMSELIEDLESQGEYSAPSGPSVGEIMSGGTGRVIDEISESFDFEELESYTAYTADGAVTVTSEQEFEDLVEAEIEAVGLANVDINNDHVADVVNLRFGVSLTDNNPDGDIASTALEFYCGTDPNVADINDWDRPVIHGMNNVISGSNPKISICSIPGDTVDLVIVNASETEDLFAQASVLSADDVQSKEIFVGTATVDDGNKGSINVPEALPDGEYYLFAIGDNGTGVASLTVNSEESLKDLTLEVSKENLILGPTVDGVVVLASKANEFEKDEYLNQFAGEADESIVLTAEKDTIVYITIQSRIFSSVVIADANGMTQIHDSVIAELQPGSHTITAYSSDPETNKISNLISFIYTKN